MSPNRVVAVATPLVFAPLAGGIAAWAADHFPGVEVDPNALEEIFIAGALIALAPAAQWLHGWQKFEARQADLTKELVVEGAHAPAAGSAAALEEDAGLEELIELEDLGEIEDIDDLDELEADLLPEEEEPATAGT
jgi:hypothetical protein